MRRKLDTSDRPWIYSGYAKRRTGVAACVPVTAANPDILAALLLNPEREYSVTGLAERFDAPPSTVHGEVKRLTEAGLLSRRHIGRSAMIRANTGNRLVGPLAELLFLSWGLLLGQLSFFAQPQRP